MHKSYYKKMRDSENAVLTKTKECDCTAVY